MNKETEVAKDFQNVCCETDFVWLLQFWIPNHWIKESDIIFWVVTKFEEIFLNSKLTV